MSTPGDERASASRPLDEEEVKMNQLEVVLRLIREIKAIVENRSPEMQEAGLRETGKLWANFFQIGDWNSLVVNSHYTPLPPADQPLVIKKEEQQHE